MTDIDWCFMAQLAFLGLCLLVVFLPERHK